MNLKNLFSLVLVASALTLPTVCRAAETNRFPPQLLTFSAAKEQQARQLAGDLKLQMAPEVWAFFQAANHGDWPAASNTFAQLRRRAGQYQDSTNDPAVASPVWQTLLEVDLGFEAFGMGGTKYPAAFGEGIIQSIPAGSIYFGGTDPGRGLVTALCASHAEARPFFTLTQNALADARYLDYLRSMYGRRIYIPTAEDSQKAFADYTMDVQSRLKHDENFPKEPRQIRPGEDVRMSEGRVQISGQVAVMAINGLLVKTIFERNTNREFYLEESFPLDWMYPYLSPHGLIFKLNRAPLPQLTTALLDADHAFWSKQCGSMLGGWLQPETPVSNVCAFAEAVYVRKDFSQFTGDREFATNDYAMKSFSKLRASLAGVYQWRLTSKTDTGDKARLRAETDYAFRQAFALCPHSPEAVFRYVNFLLGESRFDDAIRLVRTTRKLDPDNEQMQNLLSQLLSYRQQQKEKKAP